MRWHSSSIEKNMIYSFGFWLLFFGVKPLQEDNTDSHCTWSNLYMFASEVETKRYPERITGQFGWGLQRNCTLESKMSFYIVGCEEISKVQHQESGGP